MGGCVMRGWLQIRRVGKGALAPCPPSRSLHSKVGTLRFAQPTGWSLAAVMVAALALPQSASAATPRIISMNICTDQLLLAIADPSQIMGLSRFSRDARQGLGDKARNFPILSGGAEDILVAKPDVVAASAFDKRSTREILKANGQNLVEFPIPRTLADVRQQIRQMGD